jgi:cytidylate kinase
MVTITISGTPGSGKSTVAQILEKKLGLRYVYSGILFRHLAKKHKMSLEEFGKYCETHREVDQELDDAQLEILRKGNVIVEGRLAGWLAYRHNIPAVKIVIDTDLETRAKRIVKREKGTIEQRKREMRNREKSEALRYKNYYNIDLKDTSIYNLVIDSTNKTAEEIADVILKYIEN